MIGKIKKHPRITIAVIVVLVVVFIVLVLTNRKAVPTPTPTPSRPKFSLLRTFPNPGTQETAFPSTAISFSFSQAVDEKSLRVAVSPFAKIEVSYDQTGQSVYIHPVPAWRFGVQYKITLSVSSKDGDQLEEPVVYEFAFSTPTESNMTEQPNP